MCGHFEVISLRIVHEVWVVNLMTVVHVVPLKFVYIATYLKFMVGSVPTFFWWMGIPEPNYRFQALICSKLVCFRAKSLNR